MPAAADAINRDIALPDAAEEMVHAVVPVLSPDDMTQIRSVFLTTQAACVRIKTIRGSLKRRAPSFLETLTSVR